MVTLLFSQRLFHALSIANIHLFTNPNKYLHKNFPQITPFPSPLPEKAVKMAFDSQPEAKHQPSPDGIASKHDFQKDTSLSA